MRAVATLEEYPVLQEHPTLAALFPATLTCRDSAGLLILMLTGSRLEGSWEEVTRVIGQAHALLHGKGTVRIQSDIRIGSRIDKAQTMEDKVSAVERLLANDE